MLFTRYYKSLKFITLLFFLCLTSKSLLAQDSRTIDSVLFKLSDSIPALKNEVSFSASDVTIQEFLRGVANSTNLNLVVDPTLNARIINNFNNVKVYDLLAYMCKQYKLNIANTGNILTVSPVVVTPIIIPKKTGVISQSNNDTVSFDFSSEKIINVTREIINATQKNVIVAPGCEEFNITCYIKEMPFEKALQKLAFANNLEMKKTPDGFFILQMPQNSSMQKPMEGNQGLDQSNNQYRTNNYYSNNEIALRTDSPDSISLFSQGNSLNEIINTLADKLKFDNIFITPISGNIVGRFNYQTLDQLLANLFKGTNFTFKKQGKIYLFGDKKNLELREYRVISLKNRPVTKILESIPPDFTKELEIKEYAELNSIIVSGATPKIDDLESFLKQIDIVVPVIQIEVMVVDVRKTFTVSAGISAGTGEAPSSSQTLFSGVDYTLSTKSINRLINSFNQFGSVNIGKVTPSFYLSIKALEDQGIIDVRSTPKLSTVNGHEASMSIGKTTYYKEEQSNVYGSLSTSISTMRTYKPVTADFTINIKPQLSDGDQITLDIEVKQSDFTDKIEPTAPPGTTSRSFKSLIRIKNEEMVLLGGLEEERKDESASGFPLLSRIPVIKWLFSSRTKSTGKTKLNIFVKPTIIK
jgi:type IV pilus assembly protein PilQ